MSSAQRKLQIKSTIANLDDLYPDAFSRKWAFASMLGNLIECMSLDGDYWSTCDHIAIDYGIKRLEQVGNHDEEIEEMVDSFLDQIGELSDLSRLDASPIVPPKLRGREVYLRRLRRWYEREL